MEAEVLTIKEAAQYLKSCESTIRAEMKRGKLHGFRVGNRIRFTIEELKEYTEKGQSN